MILSQPTILALLGLPFSVSAVTVKGTRDCISIPEEEPIKVIELPLPPVIPAGAEDSCLPTINPSGTGCIGVNSVLVGGSFLPDGNHVVASINFTGASDTIYTGTQLILVKTDGTVFPNGDPWKCVTCGIPEAQMNGSSSLADYPQSFRDGKRLMAGSNIVDCSPAFLNSTDCTPENIYIYPIHFDNKADGSGSGWSLRELRLHPDNVHLSLNSIDYTSDSIAEYPFFGRLEFNPSPKTGTPLVARYDVINATILYPSASDGVFTVNGDELIFNSDTITVGELRGFTGTGQEITYVGSPVESCNIDLFAANLTSGAVRRITTHPEYADPIDVSHNDEWQVVLDTRGSGRMMFLAAMRGVPPLTDMVSTAVVASVRNNGVRRFFQPYLLDRNGDHDYDYYGQQLNADGDGSPGSINDPNWNAMADPRWSLDGTRITYYQWMVVSPACGGVNPLPCPNSTEPGGRPYRLMMATLIGRKPIEPLVIDPVPDTVPWAIAYTPGDSLPTFSLMPSGTYTLQGKVSGHANVSIAQASTGTYVESVAVTYENYCDNGDNTIFGWENVTVSPISATTERLDWYSNLTSIGVVSGTKVTSPDGFHLTLDVLTNIFEATGSLNTTINGETWLQPDNDS